jgi:ankyrin repeat protein
MVDNGARVDTMKDEWARTPLFLAAEKGHDTIVRFLLGKGASPDRKDIVGRTALSLAVENEHAAVVKSLLDHGADVQLSLEDSWSSWTSLLHAAVERNRNTGQLFTGNMTSTNVQGSTALWHPTFQQNNAVVQFLSESITEIESGLMGPQAWYVPPDV